MPARRLRTRRTAKVARQPSAADPRDARTKNGVSATSEAPRPALIAVLGWGSLLWDPRALRLRSSWQLSELYLPLEFSRISKDKRLTLVIDAQHGCDLPVAFARADFDAVAEAVANLREREGCLVRDIGVVSASSATPDDGIRARIHAWAVASKYDAVIWTNLRPQGFDPFSFDAAVAHLASLSDTELRDARRYIALSPGMVETPLRAHLRSRGWFDAPITVTQTQLVSGDARPMSPKTL